jgi:hypothetical protein
LDSRQRKKRLTELKEKTAARKSELHALAPTPRSAKDGHAKYALLFVGFVVIIGVGVLFASINVGDIARNGGSVIWNFMETVVNLPGNRTTLENRIGAVQQECTPVPQYPAYAEPEFGAAYLGKTLAFCIPRGQQICVGERPPGSHSAIRSKDPDSEFVSTARDERRPMSGPDPAHTDRRSGHPDHLHLPC